MCLAYSGLWPQGPGSEQNSGASGGHGGHGEVSRGSHRDHRCQALSKSPIRLPCVVSFSFSSIIPTWWPFLPGQTEKNHSTMDPFICVHSISRRFMLSFARIQP